MGTLVKILWLKLMLKKGKTYIDASAIKVTDKTSVFKLNFNLSNVKAFENRVVANNSE